MNGQPPSNPKWQKDFDASLLKLETLMMQLQMTWKPPQPQQPPAQPQQQPPQEPPTDPTQQPPDIPQTP